MREQAAQLDDRMQRKSLVSQHIVLQCLPKSIKTQMRFQWHATSGLVPLCWQQSSAANFPQSISQHSDILQLHFDGLQPHFMTRPKPILTHILALACAMCRMVAMMALHQTVIEMWRSAAAEVRLKLPTPCSQRGPAALKGLQQNWLPLLQVSMPHDALTICWTCCWCYCIFASDVASKKWLQTPASTNRVHTFLQRQQLCICCCFCLCNVAYLSTWHS